MLNGFMSGIPTEDPILENDADFLGQTDEQETDTPAESATEDNQVSTDSPSQEGETEEEATPSKETPDETNKDFHKNPRFKELVEEKNRWKAQAEELARLKVEVEQIRSQPQDNEPSIPEWFKGLYGDDADRWNDYSQYQKSQRDQVKQELLLEQQQKIQQQQQQVTRWEEYSNDSMDKLEAAGKEFDRKELKSFVEKWAPVDQYGNYDYSKGYELMTMAKAPNPEKSKARKDIADISSSNSSVSNQSKDFMTAQDLSGKSVWDLVR